MILRLCDLCEECTPKFWDEDIGYYCQNCKEIEDKFPRKKVANYEDRYDDGDIIPYIPDYRLRED